MQAMRRQMELRQSMPTSKPERAMAKPSDLARGKAIQNLPYNPSQGRKMQTLPNKPGKSMPMKKYTGK